MILCGWLFFFFVWKFWFDYKSIRFLLTRKKQTQDSLLFTFSCRLNASNANCANILWCWSWLKNCNYLTQNCCYHNCPTSQQTSKQTNQQKNQQLTTTHKLTRHHVKKKMKRIRPQMHPRNQIFWLSENVHTLLFTEKNISGWLYQMLFTLQSKCEKKTHEKKKSLAEIVWRQAVAVAARYEKGNHQQWGIELKNIYIYISRNDCVAHTQSPTQNLIIILFFCGLLFQ